MDAKQFKAKVRQLVSAQDDVTCFSGAREGSSFKDATFRRNAIQREINHAYLERITERNEAHGQALEALGVYWDARAERDEARHWAGEMQRRWMQVDREATRLYVLWMEAEKEQALKGAEDER